MLFCFQAVFAALAMSQGVLALPTKDEDVIEGEGRRFQGQNSVSIFTV